VVCTLTELASKTDVKQFIKDNRFTSMSLHNVLQGFSTTECDWTLPPKHAVSKSAKRGRVHTHVPITESAIRRELSEEFLFWYFDSFVIPLLKVRPSTHYGSLLCAHIILLGQTTFYITDSSAFRRRVLYFRQDDWDTLCQPLLDRLAATTFERIEQVRMCTPAVTVLH
jgi:telomerase reverse transcriptase